MSCQKGNGSRCRPQKYQNSHAFKNNLHDTSHKTKFINNIQVVNVCERCKKIIEWKIKYKKYKPLKAPGKCTKCSEKCVKYAYHVMCGPCASQHQVCPKCGEKGEIIKPEVEDKPLQLDRELRLLLKKLPERKRRTFLRYMNRKAAAKEKSKQSQDHGDDVTPGHELNDIDDDDDEDDADLNSDTDTITTEDTPLTRDDLLNKLKSLMISKKQRENECDFDDYGSDSDDDDDSSEVESDCADDSNKNVNTV